ncbi:MAG: gliding motility-associated C-terminal domain-containing protein [Chitinophagales bacterium]
MKHLYAKLCSLVFALLILSAVKAQPGCPIVNAGPDVTLPCTTPCTTLNATAFNVGSSSTYTVGQIPYTPFPYTGGTAVLVNIDDTWSSPIPIPFNFCFFGQAYNQFVIGSNGLITFDVAQTQPPANPTNYCAWDITASGSLPTNQMYTNSIMGPYHDIDPSLGGYINYQVIGGPPCRIFVISFSNVPMFDSDNVLSNCASTNSQTHQIVLYETTNVIEIYIQNKEACTDWNDGLAVEGIQDATGTTAFTVPGRNNTVWDAQNDAWRFTPNGPSIVTIDWFNNGANVGTGPSLNICPTTYGLYTAQATYTPCAGGTPIVVTDDVFVGTLSLGVQIDSFDNVCPGATTGAAYASFNTTSTVLNYGWNPGPANTTTLSNVGPGTYIFSVSIAGCTRSDTVTITNTTAPSVTVNDSTFFTCNPPGNAGVLGANPSGGSGTPYAYSWAPGGQTGQYATGLTAGNYTVTVTDAGGCTASDAGQLIYQSSSPTFSPPQITNVSCNGGNDGGIVVFPTSGQTPWSFAWSPAQPNNDTITGLTQGAYSVTATDANGCSVSASYNVTQPTALSLGAPTLTGATCTTGGSISVTASGGTGTLTYAWSNGQSGNSISNLAAGGYDLTVTDQNLCTITATYNITAAPNVVTFGAPAITNVSCNGGNDGSITVNASGGTGTIGFGWGGGQTGATINSLIAGNYNVTATDINGCSASTTYVVTEPTALVIGAPTIVDATCTTGGSITVTAYGGTGTLNYSWNNGAFSGSSITGLAAGNYDLTVTDQNLCSATASYTVNAGPNAVIISNPVVTDVSCNGAADGSITITVGGGTGTLTVSWSNAAGNVTTISSLAPNTYSVTATDQSGCSTSSSYVVAEPALLVIDSVTIQNVNCSNPNSGALTAYASGGNTGGYTYAWTQQSNSQTYSGQAINGLVADTYTLTITDSKGCSATGTYTITQPTALTFTQAHTDVSCFGGNDGTATITITTGTAPYTFDWNGAGPTANSTISGLAAGTVNVTITDANCSATASIIISEPSAVQITLVSQTDVSCYNSTDGAITISANGGTPGYTYNWSNLASGPSVSNLAPGPIDVTAVDANSCQATATYTIIAPSALNASATATDALCYQAPNGTATVSASGGTQPYNYLWSDNQTTPEAIGLVANYYSVTVLDNNNCSATAGATVNEPAAMNITYSATAVLCIGDENGTLTVSVNGGTGPYNYSATQDMVNFVSTTDGVIKDLAAGDYTIIISDNNGCTKTIPATVPDATPDAFQTVTDSTSCYGDQYTDGEAHVIATSIQNGPYLFSMDGGIQQYSGDFYNLSAGNHTITAYNFNGCESTIPVVILQPLPIIVDVTPDTLVLPLGEGGQVSVSYLNAGSAVHYSWEPSLGLSCIDCPNPFVTVYQNGDYLVTVSEQNGTTTCYGSATLHVDVLPEQPVFVPNSFTPNGDGNNDLFLIYGQDVKTMNLKIFNRWGELVFESTNQLQGWDGTYRGQLQNDAVFTYDVMVTFLNNKKVEKKGTVTLLR